MSTAKYEMIIPMSCNETEKVYHIIIIKPVNFGK